ncbi:VOC family protein [Nocardia blacklockiae]|uniref:VOC family protein n=1 Tax=Nocardia blacklockiae TaxID=480036 RepID=UPI001892F660|nr:VOC family protein [Nocardia blacklockiae]MBF6175402.1 VOC family protein [Nocardia blacklockiae]
MNWTLEVVVVPVTDIDRAKEFYGDKLGFVVDHDITVGDGSRVVQLTPPGSGCSIVIGQRAFAKMEPGSLHGLQLVVPDLPRARAELLERGFDPGEIQEVAPSPDGSLDNIGFLFFADPDGNAWGIQQISTRA